MKAAELAAEIKRIDGAAGIDVNAKVCEDISKAIPLALSEGLPVIAFGSLYSAGTIRKTYRQLYGRT